MYAPSVTGYKPIALSVQPQPGLLTRGALYPPSEDYRFKPLNEHVQVYQRPFRIVQDVLIDASRQLNSPFGFRLYSHVGSDVPRERSTPVPLSRRILPWRGRDGARCISPRTFGSGASSPSRSSRRGWRRTKTVCFQWEARSISALNHPNVITIYDIGEADGRHFIATEFIEGETLRARVSAGPLAPALAVDLVMQAARGLAAAHALGIVHRDIKPENVMIRRDGLVKVLDFGLAKFVSDDDPVGTAVTGAFETMQGEILGTVAYMSPEQARGLLVDARSDVFSLGVVFYEMLSGRPPFLSETPMDTLAAVLNQAPASLSHLPDVGAALDRAVLHALEKERDKRWPSMGSFADAVREALGGMTAPGGRTIDRQPALDARTTGVTEMPAAPARETSKEAPISFARGRRRIDSLAVLPFVNATRDDDLQYLGDGLTESLINNLSQIPKLRVMARGTVYRYKGRDADPQQIGRELGVKAVVSGRIVQASDRFRIAEELVDAGNGSQMWGSQFTRPPSDLLLVEEEIAREITEALKLNMATAVRRRLRRSAPASASALDLYLKGRYFWNKRSQDGLQKAADFFERAIADDPNFALAHSGLADSYTLMGAGYTAVQGVGRIDRAREAAERALALDETVAEAHASLAYIKLRFDWEWEIIPPLQRERITDGDTILFQAVVERVNIFYFEVDLDGLLAGL